VSLFFVRETFYAETMASIPSEMYSSMTGNTARAFRLGGTAAEMKGMDAQLEHPTAASARIVRYTLLPKTRDAAHNFHKQNKSSSGWT
jgi:hypothetical protein